MAAPGFPQLTHTVALMLAPVASVKIGAAVVSLKVPSNSTVVPARAVPANGPSNTATNAALNFNFMTVNPSKAAAAATTQEGHRQQRSGRVGQHRRWGPERLKHRCIDCR